MNEKELEKIKKEALENKIPIISETHHCLSPSFLSSIEDLMNITPEIATISPKMITNKMPTKIKSKAKTVATAPIISFE